MKKKLLALFICILICAGTLIPVLADGTAASDVNLNLVQTKTDSNDGFIYLKASVKNNNSYAVFLTDIVPAFANAGAVPEFVSSDLSVYDKLEAGATAEYELRFRAAGQLSVEETSAEESKGCASVSAVTAVLAGLICAFAMILSKKDRVRKAGLFVLVISCCFTFAVSPVMAETESGLPSVEIADSIASGDNDAYKTLTFYAEIKDGVQNFVKADAELADGETKFNVTVTLGFCEYEITGMGIRAVPISGLNSLPVILQKGKKVDLTTAYGIDLPITASEDARKFSGEYPDRIYTSKYNVKYYTAAYIEYSMRGESGVIWSDTYEASVLTSARNRLEAEGISEEEKAAQQKIIDTSGKKAVITEEEEKALRDGIIGKMEEMASIYWSPQSTVNTTGKADYGTPTYLAKKTYRGLIYNGHGYGTVEDFGYYTDENNVLVASSTKSLNALWLDTPGVSCSTSIEGAYAYYVAGIETYTGTIKMLPSKTGYGFSKIGTYAVPVNAETTESIIKANDEQKMYAAYAQLKTADILLAVWYNANGSQLGHSIQVIEAPKVVYNSDGTINPDKSTIKTIEQHSTVIVVDGCLTTWKHSETTFSKLLNGTTLKYIPVQYTGLVSESVYPLYTLLSGFNSGSVLKDGIKGTFESDFPIRWIGVTVTDASGKIVYERKTTPTGGYKKAVLASSLTNINAGLKSVAAGTYTVKIDVCAKNTVKTLYEGTEVK